MKNTINSTQLDLIKNREITNYRHVISDYRKREEMRKVFRTKHSMSSFSRKTMQVDRSLVASLSILCSYLAAKAWELDKVIQIKSALVRSILSAFRLLAFDRTFLVSFQVKWSKYEPTENCRSKSRIFTCVLYPKTWAVDTK